MTAPDFERTGDASRDADAGIRQTIKDAAGDAFSKASDTAKDAGAKAKRAASDAASTVSDQVMGILDDQLGVGAQSVDRFARAMTVAAGDLDKDSPVLAALLRNSARKVEGYGEQLENQTVEGLVKATADITRRQPALMFGLAAVAGFFAYRTFKTAGAGQVSSPPTQPADDMRGQGR